MAGGGWRLGFIALLLIVAAVAFIQSYQRWLDPIIDTGRDLYIPEQLVHGRLGVTDLSEGGTEGPRRTRVGNRIAAHRGA